MPSGKPPSASASSAFACSIRLLSAFSMCCCTPASPAIGIPGGNRATPGDPGGGGKPTPTPEMPSPPSPPSGVLKASSTSMPVPMPRSMRMPAPEAVSRNMGIASCRSHPQASKKCLEESGSAPVIAQKELIASSYWESSAAASASGAWADSAAGAGQGSMSAISAIVVSPATNPVFRSSKLVCSSDSLGGMSTSREMASAITSSFVMVSTSCGRKERNSGEVRSVCV
mmetsp:Transcript_7617/g.16620  ORF Transcript_7617/g.16620 Transcript_7617/m.16620 type:complete len:228 (-) Transcript_7617:286-969(-)